MKKWMGVALCLLGLWSMAGCGAETASETGETSSVVAEAQSVKAERTLFAMDTYMTITAYGENGAAAVDAAEAEILRLDALLSSTEETSDVYEINENGGGVLSEEIAMLFNRSADLTESTDGAFNIAVYPLVQAWGFIDQNYQVPSAETIASLLPLTDFSAITYDPDSATLTLPEGAAIAFGAIAKGYTSARVMEIFDEYGIESGIVNLGGNVQVCGSKIDGTPWRIAVRSPESENDYLCVLSVTDQAVITSGGYERYFEQDGVTYHHILDPATGSPAESDLTSVTIVCDDGTLADGLSTSLFVMGKDKAIEYWKAHSEEFDAVLLTEDGNLWVTEGVADKMSTERNVTVIRS